MKRILLTGILLLISSLGFAQENGQPLPVEQVFHPAATVTDADTITVHWDILPGYYLYKDRFQFKLAKPANGQATPAQLPEGIHREDDIIGKYEAYEQSVDIPLNVANAQGKITLLIGYQGCSENNFCYPPQAKQITLNLNIPNSAGTGIKDIDPDELAAALPHAVGSPTSQSEQDKVTELLSQHSLWVSLLSFLGFGLLLSFTPCVLPMIPILSGIIIGHGKHISGLKAFWLSFTYVLAMSVTYAIVGVIAGFAGGSIQAAMQTPWVITAFSIIFVLLALSLFGFYELQLPAKWQEKITGVSSHQQSGTYLGVAIMGVLSTLIVSPCVTAPLVGALAYIGNTGDAVLGGLALWAMGIGMGIPLIIIGTSHGKLLPKAGPWMDNVKAFFGVIMLAVAIWMLSRIIPGQLAMALWAILLLVSAVYMGLLHREVLTGWAQFWKGLSLVMAIYGIILMIGAATGNTDPLQPLGNLNFASDQVATSTPSKHVFTQIKTVDDLNQQLDMAKQQNKITLLDFYADWCLSCLEMEKQTFSDPTVQATLANLIVLQADVTQNDAIDKALQKANRVVAPPTIMFFDQDGDEIPNSRIVGTMGPEKFIEHIRQFTTQ
ncbi:MAG: cytochrome C biogenesis protein [Legionellales bacterium]|nr:cytochrome C biogenesis protein [Legionellales bacterium]|tara:strand:+ start:69037 stop:70857 length:1821 start_codon:yes stop_codon:yes gene_type:complete